MQKVGQDNTRHNKKVRQDNVIARHSKSQHDMKSQNMTRQEKMLSSHMASLSFNYSEEMLCNFSKPIVEGDSITSLYESKKIAHITRHLLTGEATHSLILKDEMYCRV